MQQLSTLKRKNGSHKVKADDTMSSIKKTVDFLKRYPNKVFTMQDIRTLKLIPWTQNDRTLKRLIEQDIKGENELKAKIEGIGSHTRYYIKGKNIINFIKRYGAMFIANRSIK